MTNDKVDNTKTVVSALGFIAVIAVSLLMWGFFGIIPIFAFALAIAGKSKKAYLGVAYVMLFMVVFGWLFVSGPTSLKILFSGGIVSLVWYLNNTLE